MGMYVKWSWLLYMASAMWSSLIINDWTNNFQNDNVLEFMNNSDEEITPHPKIQPKIEKEDIKEAPLIRKPYKLIKKSVLKEDLKLVEPVSIQNDTPASHIILERHETIVTTTLPSLEILEDVNLNFKLLDGLATWWHFNWFWNCIVLIILTLIYVIGRTFWKYGQDKVPKKEPSWKKPSTPNITSSLTQQKKLISKIPTYKFKRSISDMAVKSSSNNHETANCELINSDTSNLIDMKLRNNHLVQEINDYKKKLNDEEEMCFKLRQELIHIHDGNERDRENLNRKLEAVTIEKKELSKQLSTALKENDTLRQKLDEITFSRDNTTRKLNRMKEELRKSAKEKCNLNKQIIVMRKQNVNLHQTLERCRREVKQHQEKVNELEREILQLKTRLQCATILSKKNFPLKEHVNDLSPNGITQIETATPENLNPTKLSKFDIYTDVKTRIKNLEKDIVNWETKNNCDQIIKPKQEDLQISEIFHSCCDNSNDDSSECGLTTDAFYSDHIVTFYHEEEFQAAFTDSTTTTTTSDDVTTSLYSGKPSNSDHLININDPAFEINFNEEYNRLMVEKLEHAEKSESKGIITKQTTFLRKYFQDTSNFQDGFNCFSNDIESVLNNKNNGKMLSNKRCRVSVHVCSENSNTINNNQENILQNSLAYKLLSNFDPSWQGGSMSLTSTSGSKNNSSPESCNDIKCDEKCDLCSLD